MTNHKVVHRKISINRSDFFFIETSGGIEIVVRWQIAAWLLPGSRHWFVQSGQIEFAIQKTTIKSSQTSECKKEVGDANRDRDKRSIIARAK